MKILNPLPLDYARCKPLRPDDRCQNCKRWAEAEGQTFGERAVYVVTTDSRDRACIQITLSELSNDN